MRRLNGTSKKDSAYPRDPFGWYVEPTRCVEQLFDLIDFGDEVIWDPSCGRGTILDVARRRGHHTFGSDLVDRWRPGGHPFVTLDFLRAVHGPRGAPFSIVNNPPYNEPEPGIAEKFIRHAHKLGGWHRSAFLVPVSFQCSEGRYRLFVEDCRPSHVISLMERPSMPPGAMLEARGESCRGGGMEDYCWLVFTRGYRGDAAHLFAKPTNAASLDTSTRRVRARRSAASATAA